VELAVKSKLMLDSIDAWLLKQPSLVNARKKTLLLSGTMTCGACGAAIAQVSGKSGGYYGCLGAAKGACENKMLVR